MAIVVDSYYQKRESLNDLDNTGKKIVEILGELYFESPVKGESKLSYTAFKDFYVMSAVKTMHAKLSKNIVSFVPILLSYYDNVYYGASSNNMSYPNFYVHTTQERAVIFGCLYYMMYFDETFSARHMKKVESLIGDKDWPFFQVFKEAAEKDKQEADRNKASQNASTEDIIDKNLRAEDGKRIILAKGRNSDFTRIIQAMITDDYFRHVDQSQVTAKEVGEMMLKLLGVNTEWKSMLQKAYSRDKPLKTFDNLRDAAQKYWTDRAHLDD